MENYLYTCQYCGKEYKPNRRQKQKYCSNSCRTRAFVIRKNKEINLLPKEIKSVGETKSEGMSLSGVGNAAVGSLAVNIVTSFFTKEENKPATKNDIEEVKNLLMTRYHSVKNMQRNINGNLPFYDMGTKSIVYLKK